MSASAQGLCEFIDASPSPFHVCVTVAQRLSAAGFTELSERDEWPAEGRFFTVRAGSLVAWRVDEADRTGPFRIVGAHTDSPNLRVKQHPDRFVAGWQVVALAPYGGAWLNSWLDRDLGISGRLSVRVGNTIDHRLVRIDEPILRVPQLAIHLAEDRKAVSLDPQRHVNAVWGVGSGTRTFLGYVAEHAGVDEAAVLGADLMTHDLTPSRLVGANHDLLSAPRLDNQATCYAGLEAFLAAEPGEHMPVIALSDHGEIGSQSDHGAQSGCCTVLERITLAAGRSRGLPAPAARVDGRLRRHGARHPPEFSRAARARPPHRGQRRPGAQGAAEPAICHRRAHRSGLRAGMCTGRRAAAALRAPGGPAVWVDDRPDDLGAHRHPDRRRRRAPAGHAFGA
jgi:aspartyl aminopeptidase